MSSTTIIGASLPPMVEGQLRCFLSIKLGELVWDIPRPPKDIQVRIVWWGQTGNSAILRPQVDTDPNYVVAKNKHAEVHYPIRCGPRQFEAYLKDMGGLRLDIIFGPSCTSFASVNVVGIDQLSSTQVLDSYYPSMCTTPAFEGKEVGKLQVTASFKSISDTYNISSSIIPTTDKEFQQPATTNKKSKDTKPKSGTAKQLPKKTAAKNKQTKVSSKPPTQVAKKPPIPGNVATGVDFIVGPGARLDHYFEKEKEREDKKLKFKSSNKKSDEEESDEDIAEPFVTRNIGNRSVQEAFNPREDDVEREQPIILKGEQRAAVLSSLLHKTQQLRDSMIKHALNSETVPIKSETTPVKGSGGLIKELLKDMKHEQSSLDFDTSDTEKTTEDLAIHEMEKLDTRVVDLLLGKEDNIEQLLQKVNMSMDSNFSNYSDDQDPLHDSSLLDELLYTTKRLQHIDESSILSLNESNSEELNIKEANKNMNLNKQSTFLDASCDLIPTKETLSNVVEKEKCDEEDDTFDSIASAPLESEDSNTVTARLVPDCVTVEKLTQLGRVKSAKVILKEFSLCTNSLKYGRVYFVEFRFPVSMGENGTPLMEHVRHVSRQINNVVDFGRFSVFPIIFNEEMVEFWWQKSISFTVYVKYERQEKAEWFGEGYFKLREVLLNEEMKMNVEVDVYNDKNNESNDHTRFSPIGQLKLFVELSMENSKASSHMNSKANVAYAATVPPEKAEKQDVPTYPLTPIKINTKISKRRVADQTTKSNTDENVHQRQPSDNTRGNIFLHNLLVVTSGKDIVYTTSNNEGNFSNSYFICRVFWNNGELKSKICWNNDNPNYGFQQIIPVTLTADVINKMENNFMIIEVWHKSTTTDKDKLIGMSKLSLHQFFLSFKDSSLAQTILKSKYPVIANDGPVPVVNLFSGKDHGSLDIVFALGTHDQVTEVLQMKKVCVPSHMDKERRRTMSEVNQNMRNIEEGMVDHCFEVTIENMKGLMQDNDEVWGESDCYVQYHFPEQNNSNDIKMTTVKTKTTLCLPNPVFRDTSSHSFYLKKNVPLQKLLLECFQATSTDIVFEVWKRRYYPNVRDQFIGKASLPLAKVCAMITMHAGKDSDQCFHLPVVGRNGSYEIDKESAGILDVSFVYKLRSRMKNYVHHDLQLPKELVCLSLSINRLCGLKDGLSDLSKKYKKLGNAARTGPNVFVKMYLSFIGKTSIKITNVAAKSFCPSFSYHVDFPLPLKFGDGHETCLAEMLEDGSIVCEVVHEFIEAELEDMVVCVAKIPLVNVLSRSTGIKGWWPLILGDSDREEDKEDIIAGGIEVNGKFCNNNDREKIINVARGMGWSPYTYLGLHDESWFPLDNNAECKPSLLNIYVDIVNIPANVIDNLLCKYTDVKHHFETMYCRYKLYNKAPIYSKSAKVNAKDKQYYCSLSHLSNHEIIPNTSLAWYLREEQLEIQFWLSWSNYTVNDSSFTRQKDKLVGSVYIDMSSFAHSPYDEKVISRQFPLFNANCDSICKATARISIAFNTNISKDVAHNIPLRHDGNSADVSCISSGDDEDKLLNDICQKKTKEDNQSEIDDEDGEKVNIQIEEAMHLHLTNTGSDPNIYLTYQLPNTRLVYTNMSSNEKRHKWNFQKQHKINVDALKGKNLVFHMWKCNGEKQNVERDILIGTSAVDTGTLFYGMKQIIGWYNIHDLNRQIIGQIKLGIVPAISLSTPISPRYFRTNPQIQPIDLTKNHFPRPSFSSEYHFSKPSLCSENHLPKSSFSSVSKTANEDNCSRPSANLFQKLNTQLQDLQELTSHIQQRVCKDPNPQMFVDKTCETSHVSSQTKHQEQISPPGNGNNNDVAADSGEISFNALLINSNSNSVVNECIELSSGHTLEKQDVAVEGGPSLPIAVEKLSHVSTYLLENASASASDEYNVNENGRLPEERSEEHLDDAYNENIVNDGNSSFGSADELLDDLKKFQEKFTLIKNSLEENSYEQDSWLSDVEIVDTCLTHVPEVCNTVGVTDALELNIENNNGMFTTSNMRNNHSDEGIEDREGMHFKVNEINDDLAEHVCRKVDHTKENGFDFGNQFSNILPQEELESYHESPTSGLSNVKEDEGYEAKGNGIDHIHISDEEVISSSDSGIKSPNIELNFEPRKNVELPNFFMGSEELAESMQALRVAAKLRQSPRTRSSYSGDETTYETSSLSLHKVKNKDDCTRSKGNKELKEKIRKALPVEVSEMARIANIFSLKSQTK